MQKENPWPVPTQRLVFHADCWFDFSKSVLHQSLLNRDAACPSLVTSSILLSPSILSIHFYHADFGRKPKENEGPTGGSNHTVAPQCVVHIKHSHYFLCSASDLVELHPELLGLSKSDDSTSAWRHTQILAWVLLIMGWTQMWWPLLSVLSSNLKDLLQMEGAFISCTIRKWHLRN